MVCGQGTLQKGGQVVMSSIYVGVSTFSFRAPPFLLLPPNFHLLLLLLKHSHNPYPLPSLPLTQSPSLPLLLITVTATVLYCYCLYSVVVSPPPLSPTCSPLPLLLCLLSSSFSHVAPPLAIITSECCFTPPIGNAGWPWCLSVCSCHCHRPCHCDPLFPLLTPVIC